MKTFGGKLGCCCRRDKTASRAREITDIINLEPQYSVRGTPHRPGGPRGFGGRRHVSRAHTSQDKHTTSAGGYANADTATTANSNSGKQSSRTADHPRHQNPRQKRQQESRVSRHSRPTLPHTTTDSKTPTQNHTHGQTTPTHTTQQRGHDNTHKPGTATTATLTNSPSSEKFAHTGSFCHAIAP